MKMNSNKALVLARLIYDEAHIAVWAACVAFVLYFLVVVAPKLPAVRAQAEWQRAQDVTAEHECYCAKFGMAPGTAGHSQCLADLQEFRAKVEQRVADDNSF
jgi:hypothetical protein